ncbi:hypothetical protein BHM03_00048429 [Ensete ventricosum]|nr:hypothetical protein BHM03_00048429 [Ensete ventricosum]
MVPISSSAAPTPAGVMHGIHALAVPGRPRLCQVSHDCARLAAIAADRAKWDVLLNDRKSCAKLTEVRGIVNLKNSVLMQGLVCGRWSVRGHPKATETWRHGTLKLSLQYEKDTSVGD